MAVSSPIQRKPTFSSAATWLQAWNIYIRGMVKFYPEIAPTMHVYQESLCNLQGHYPITSWLRKDTSFRINMALNKHLSWNHFDDKQLTSSFTAPRALLQINLLSSRSATNVQPHSQISALMILTALHLTFVTTTPPPSGSLRPVHANFVQPCEPKCTFPHVCK